MTTPHDKALAPCPFCGTVEGLYPSYHFPGSGAPYAIDCVGCGMDFTPREGMEVFEAWNRRAPLPIAGKGDEGWQAIDTAPKDGKHCLLAVKEGPFIYVVQGAFHAGQWNAVHRDNVAPLCWMPNIRIPAKFIPAPPSLLSEDTEGGV